MSAPSDAGSPATTGAADPTDGVADFLTDDLSPWGMFLHADIVVKVVILGLIFASVITWTIWLAKTVELAVAKRRLRRACGILRGAESLMAAVDAFQRRSGIAQVMVCEADDEWRRSAGALEDRDGLKERVSLHLGRVETLAGRRMLVGTGLLATIGSTAPFVGLFGTVWGIMNSFVGISRMHTTNLAVVAPGIAEALLATACGLVAAIPAVVIYNHFARQISGYKTLVANAAAAVMALVSRDLSHGETVSAASARGDMRRQAAERSEGKAPLRLME
jgi:biopolymer transport protein ExbB